MICLFSGTGGGNPSESSASFPQEQSGVNGDTGPSASPSAAALVPPPPSLSIQAPASPSLSVQSLPGISSVDKNGTQLPVPVNTQGDYDYLNCSGLHGLCRRRGYPRKDPKAVSKTRLSLTDAVERKRNRGMADAVEA